MQVRYTFRLTREEPADATTSAEMRFNRRVAADEASAAAQAEREAGADDVALGLADVPQQQLRIAAGALEQIELDGVAGAQLTASFEVVRGRDVDFGIMLVRPSRDGDGHAAAEEAIRLFGPCRRATGLATTVLVPEAGRVVLTFDNSGAPPPTPPCLALITVAVGAAAPCHTARATVTVCSLGARADSRARAP